MVTRTNSQAGGSGHESVIVFKVEDLPPNLRTAAESYLMRHGGTPAAMLRPNIAVTASVCIAFSDMCLEETQTGAGQTPQEALAEFNRKFQCQILLESNENKADATTKRAFLTRVMQRDRGISELIVR